MTRRARRSTGRWRRRRRRAPGRRGAPRRRTGSSRSRRRRDSRLASKAPRSATGVTSPSTMRYSLESGAPVMACIAPTRERRDVGDAGQAARRASEACRSRWSKRTTPWSGVGDEDVASLDREPEQRGRELDRAPPAGLVGAGGLRHHEHERGDDRNDADRYSTNCTHHGGTSLSRQRTALSSDAEHVRSTPEANVPARFIRG